MKALIILAFALVAAVSADQGYGYQQPKAYCRDTNTSIYAEVCVPGFAPEAKPVDLAIKNVAEDEFCFTQTQTECEETTKNVEREICTYAYEQRREKLDATTTKLTYEDKSETMKVTTCSASGYAPKPYSPYGPHAHESGEHQYCREEYQTQEYRLPKVDEPLAVQVDGNVPEPKKECTTLTLEVTEVVCKDVEVEKCIVLAKLDDAVQTIEQTEVVLGEPNCNKITLSLPTEVCAQHHAHGYGHH